MAEAPARSRRSYLDLGHTDLTVLDISQAALDAARARLGSRAAQVGWIRSDLARGGRARLRGLARPGRPHCLTDPGDQRHYAALVARALAAGGHAVIGTFALRRRGTLLRPAGHPPRPESLAGLLGDDFETIVAQHHTRATPRRIASGVHVDRGAAHGRPGSAR